MQTNEEYTHGDIITKVEQAGNDIKRLFRLVAAGIPFVAGSFIWIWSAHANQQAFNADINARTQGNSKSYEEARQAQARIESRLDEIQRFLREDSRELREEIRQHMRGHE